MEYQDLLSRAYLLWYVLRITLLAVMSLLELEQRTMIRT